MKATNDSGHHQDQKKLSTKLWPRSCGPHRRRATRTGYTKAVNLQGDGWEVCMGGSMHGRWVNDFHVKISVKHIWDCC